MLGSDSWGRSMRILIHLTSGLTSVTGRMYHLDSGPSLNSLCMIAGEGGVERVLEVVKCVQGEEFLGLLKVIKGSDIFSICVRLVLSRIIKRLRSTFLIRFDKSQLKNTKVDVAEVARLTGMEGEACEQLCVDMGLKVELGVVLFKEGGAPPPLLMESGSEGYRDEHFVLGEWFGRGEGRTDEDGVVDWEEGFRRWLLLTETEQK